MLVRIFLFSCVFVWRLEMVSGSVVKRIELEKKMRYLKVCICAWVCVFTTCMQSWNFTQKEVSSSLYCVHYSGCVSSNAETSKWMLLINIYCTYTFTRMTHRCWSHFCFPSAQQNLREKWVELQSLTLQEKRLTRGEKKTTTVHSCSDSWQRIVYLPERVTVGFTKWIWNKLIYMNNAQMINV